MGGTDLAGRVCCARERTGKWSGWERFPLLPITNGIHQATLTFHRFSHSGVFLPVSLLPDSISASCFFESLIILYCFVRWISLCSFTLCQAASSPRPGGAGLLGHLSCFLCGHSPDSSVCIWSEGNPRRLPRGGDTRADLCGMNQSSPEGEEKDQQTWAPQGSKEAIRPWRLICWAGAEGGDRPGGCSRGLKKEGQ